MKLTVFIERVNSVKELGDIKDAEQSYELTPGQKRYIAGSDKGCSLPLPDSSDVSTHHIEFSFSSNEGVWQVKEISQKNNVFVNGNSLFQYRPVTQYPINSQTRIEIGSEISLIATPVDVEASTTYDEALSTIAQPSSLARESERAAATGKSGGVSTVLQDSIPKGNQNRVESSSIARGFDSLSWQDIGAPSIVNLGFSWFKIGTPEDGVGLKIRAFDLQHTYRIDKKENDIDSICEKLYVRVYQAVSEGRLGDSKVRPVIYAKDAANTQDRRRYILITRDTVHGNRSTVFVRFIEFGENLYVGLDVYTLGNVSWFKLLKKGAITAALFFLSPLTLFLSLFAIPIIWWKLFWRIGYEKNVMLAIRQEFPGIIGGGPFDYDDVFMFSKSTVSLIVKTVRNVFEEEKLPLESLDAFIQQINNVTQINTEGGAISMVNSAVGTDNKVS
ncbi:FHA domain-containing protein [cf. Phormidesmis sp. LEGE 11477]|uniref:FHA domain-containing protein n=1 Tax=cf. Phormidesmis sp. LEGE 11477 TaxID=1828680 RepID=UPI00188266CF|nr:FHA domain-containing protein [cf. Phormidesmis sp. LEGE 11477]MBE9063945.1 FHA domain-containing protein [cf. Phormidesmis sp. LEGE 11477]